MTDKFTIKNYQIIKDGSIMIRPGITLITGPSNNGKSSIFKAYKQIVYNLSGNTYINSFADKCKLILENENYKIEYTKEKSKSSYDITVGSESSHIDKLGVNQLDKVKELTNINKELNYNFWDQLEKPFLLDRTNREQFLLLQESPISSNLLNIQENIKVDIKALKDDILVSQGSLNILNDTISKQEEILENSAAVHIISEKASSLNSLNNRLNNLMNKVKEFSATEKELNDLLPNDLNINLDTDIDEIYNRFNKINEKVAAFTEVSKMIKDENDAIEQQSKEIVKVEEIMSKYFSICPLCGNVLDENHNTV